MLVASPRNSSDLPSTPRVQVVIDRMADLVKMFEGPGFEVVHPARWRHLESGHHVETGYSYGEGRVRVFMGGGRTSDFDFVISGRDDDLDGFRKVIPVSTLQS